MSGAWRWVRRRRTTAWRRRRCGSSRVAAAAHSRVEVAPAGATTSTSSCGRSSAAAGQHQGLVEHAGPAVCGFPAMSYGSAALVALHVVRGRPDSAEHVLRRGISVGPTTGWVAAWARDSRSFRAAIVRFVSDSTKPRPTRVEVLRWPATSSHEPARAVLWSQRGRRQCAVYRDATARAASLRLGVLPPVAQHVGRAGSLRFDHGGIAVDDTARGRTRMRQSAAGGLRDCRARTSSGNWLPLSVATSCVARR
jgi:hypothetical protein